MLPSSTLLALLWLACQPASDGGTSDGGTSDGGTSDGGTSDGGTSDSGGEEEAGCAYDRWDPEDFATVIEVGPGHDAETPSDVPWEALTAGTLVRIWPEGSPYHHKWAIDAAGTQGAPIVVLGVCDPLTGALPIIDGDGATTRLALDFWSEARGLIKIGGTSTAPDTVPAWIHVEDLELRGAREGHSFIDDAGAASSYADNAAAWFVEEGEHISLRGCTLTDSGNGAFVASAARDVVISSNHLHGNGNVGSAYEHNSYTEALGITFEYNRYGPLCEGCSGNNLKDRSAGTVIRYNWIEGGNRQLDLVESSDETLMADPSYRQTFVYGNVLIEREGTDNSQIVHYGGDNGGGRQGTLYFYGNTVVSERAGNTTLLRLSDDAEQAVVRASVIHAAGTLGLVTTAGTLDIDQSWLSTGWRDSIDGTGAVLAGEGLLEGADPRFDDDYKLAEGSPCLDVGAGPPAGAEAHPLLRQYRPHQGGEVRPEDGAPDLGAFELGDAP